MTEPEQVPVVEMVTPQHLRWLLAILLWTVAGALMLISGFRGHDEETFAHWGLFIGLGAALVSAWIIAEHVARRDRLDLERWSRVIAQALDEERRTGKLH